MTITRADVADLRPGDVVEYSGHPDLHGATLRGPLHTVDSGHLLIGEYVVRRDNGEPSSYRLEDLTLTVVSRAPRPLYVNHDRAEPAPGDVIRGTQVPGVEPGTWTYTFDGWVSTRSGKNLCAPPRPARLLVDGETGMTVPQ